MRFSFTGEQEEFRDVVRRFLDERSPPAEVRRLMETTEGYDRAVWKQLCGELGLAAVHVPEAYGGHGFGFVELGIALEEMGRALLCAPYFASVALAANAVLNAGTDAQKKELLPSIAAGETVAALAFSEPCDPWQAAGVALTASPTDGGYRLDGSKTYVLDGQAADLLVVAARSPGSVGLDGLSLFTVPGDAAGVERRALTTLDTTRRQARIDFTNVRAELLGELGAGATPLTRTLEQASIALSCEMIGGAQKVLEASVSYAKTRMQFGQPIGSFQAIKHKCADMLVDIELAKSAAWYAAAAAAEDDAELPALAAIAKSLASDAYLHAAAENIQIHGGVGFTWEDDAHLYFKRAKSSEVLLGDPAHHRELLARHLDV